VPFHAARCAPFVQQPLLMMAAPDDEMPHCKPRVARAAFDRLPGRTRWHPIEGGHFGLWCPGPRPSSRRCRRRAVFLLEVLASG
jgi:hypothetical protein